MNPRLNTLDDLVKPEKGLIGRRIFVDQEIFEAEMREIFAKAWLFVGHESLVPNPDDYFISRKLYPNVDFYSGIILRAMGFPTSMFTVLFATARTIGWISQWKEMIEDPNQRIGRPRQLYTGEPTREYVDMEKR